MTSVRCFRRSAPALFAVLMLAFGLTASASAQTTAFTYQGRLADGANPANGTYQIQFALYDALTGGTQQGATLTSDGNVGNPAAVSVTNGIFTVQLDFGANVFAEGADRYLEIAVKRPGASYTILAPRQRTISTPYAVRSLSAANADHATNADHAASADNATNADHAANADNSTNADNATNADKLGNVPASGYLQTNDARLADARTPTGGSADYIQNTTALQATANFNIAGDGLLGGTLSANTVNAQTQFNLDGNRFLSNAGTGNTFAGLNTGAANTTGGQNSFFGQDTGKANKTGSLNLFLGYQAGLLNTDGGNNSFIGARAGAVNSTGTDNTFVGTLTGASNSTGIANSFFGVGAGFGNFVGRNNSFFGVNAGTNNFGGSNNTAVGSSADLGTTGLNFATALGANAVVNANDTIVIGKTAGGYNGTARPADAVQIPGSLSVAGSITGNISGASITSGTIDSARLPDLTGNYIRNQTALQTDSNFNIAGNGTLAGTLSASTVNATSAYNIGGNRVLSIAGTNNTFAGVITGAATTTGGNNASFGFAAGFNTTSGSSNSIFGNLAGALNSTGSNNTFAGRQAGASNTTGSNNTLIGTSTNVPNESNLNYATALGANALVSTDDTIVLGKAAGTYNGTVRPADTVSIPGNLSVAGTITGALSATNLTGAGAAGNFLRSNGTNFTSAHIQPSDLPDFDASKLTSGVLEVPRIPDLGPTYVRNQTTQQSSSNFNISGNGTVGGTLTANSASIQLGGGGLTLNDNFLRLRASNSDSNGLFYSSDVGGVEFRAQSGFRWTTGTSGATQRMLLDATGQLIVGSKLWTLGGILARGGAPGANNTNNNGFAFFGNSGDNDSGLFSNADHQVSLYADNIERLRVTNNDTRIFGKVGVNETYDIVSFNVRALPSDAILFRVENSDGGNVLDVRQDKSLTVVGDLEVFGSKNFKIDHPLDPTNKNLRHNAVEGPGYYTFYHGTVTLDSDGAAWVELPSYFEALNGDTHYQLTCVGGYAPVYVATEVTNNRFQIAGGRAGLKVSWQVTGDRHDPYARDNPYQAEVEKRATEKGSYLYPKGYGQPEKPRTGGASQKKAGEAERQP